MNKVTLSILCTALLGATAAGATTSIHLPQSLSRLSPADFARKTIINDDLLEDIVVLSTQRSARSEGPAKGAWIEEAHLRVIVNRGTGKASWQVWHDLAYTGARKEVSAVHYLVDGELRRSQPNVVEHWLDQCPATDAPGQCNQLTRIVFELPEEQVRSIAESHNTGSRQPWLIRFKDSNGQSVTVGFAPAELAGLLQAYEDWRPGTR